MNKDEKYMAFAIKEAEKSLEAGGAPIGAILIDDRDEAIVARGQSLVWPKKDPSAHGETECLRNACKKLDTLDLSGHTLYSTLESCSMCLACASWSKVSRIVFGAYKEDIPPNPYEIKDYSAEEHSKKLSPPIEVLGGVLRERCAKLMENIENWSPRDL